MSDYTVVVSAGVITVDVAPSAAYTVEVAPSSVFDVVLSNLQGPQGAQGPTGPQGSTGPTGPSGPSNVLSIGTVTTGSAGSSAAATITGTSPAQVLNLTIPTGATGSAGASNVLSIGTVTTGAAGSAASATITGTSPTQVLNLTIPQGAQGATGTVSVTSPITNSGTSTAANLGFDATNFVKVNQGNAWTVGGQSFNAGLTVQSNGATTVPLFIKANPTASGGQTAQLLTFVGPNNESYLGVTASGRIISSSYAYFENYYSTGSDLITLNNQGTTARTIYSQAGASQTGDILQVKNSAGTATAGITKDAKIYGDGSLLTNVSVGTSIISYLHNQATTSTSWVITHNLGYRPNVTVIESGGSTVEGDISYTSANALTLTFLQAISGVAYLS